jgi:hypothetical protein
MNEVGSKTLFNPAMLQPPMYSPIAIVYRLPTMSQFSNYVYQINAFFRITLLRTLAWYIGVFFFG